MFILLMTVLLLKLMERLHQAKALENVRMQINCAPAQNDLEKGFLIFKNLLNIMISFFSTLPFRIKLLVTRIGISYWIVKGETL